MIVLVTEAEIAGASNLHFFVIGANAPAGVGEPLRGWGLATDARLVEGTRQHRPRSWQPPAVRIIILKTTKKS